MFIFNLHCQLVLRISVTKIWYIKTRPSVKFSLYKKKAGLGWFGQPTYIHLKKSHPTVGCVSFCFYILEMTLKNYILEMTLKN